jgi:hypothetical protein
MKDTKLTIMDATAAFRSINGFMSQGQLRTLASGCRSEEQDHFIGLVVALASVVNSMPKTYETDSLGKQAVVHLHYFIGSWDWYITEKDIDSDAQGQCQAFGVADGGQGPELGYISIIEITQAGAELDLHWKPQTLAQIMGG